MLHTGMVRLYTDGSRGLPVLRDQWPPDRWLGQHPLGGHLSFGLAGKALVNSRGSVMQHDSWLSAMH